PTEITYTSSLQQITAFQPFRYQGVNYLKGVASSTLHQLKFETTCSSSSGFSTEFEPSAISYSTAGNHPIWLQAFDADGDVTGALDTVVINSNQAPTFYLTTNDNLCVGNAKTFTLTDT